MPTHRITSITLGVPNLEKADDVVHLTGQVARRMVPRCSTSHRPPRPRCYQREAST
jgi:hypothetical protein